MSNIFLNYFSVHTSAQYCIHILQYGCPWHIKAISSVMSVSHSPSRESFVDLVTGVLYEILAGLQNYWESFTKLFRHLQNAKLARTSIYHIELAEVECIDMYMYLYTVYHMGIIWYRLGILLPRIDIFVDKLWSPLYL